MGSIKRMFGRRLYSSGSEEEVFFFYHGDCRWDGTSDELLCGYVMVAEGVGYIDLLVFQLVNSFSTAWFGVEYIISFLPR